MSDSLRDQLLKAGFAEAKPKAKPPAKNRSTSKHRSGRGAKHQQRSSTKPASSQTSSAEQPATASRAPTRAQDVVAYTDVPANTPKRKKTKKAPAVKSRSGSWSTRGSTPPADDTTAGKEVSVSADAQSDKHKSQIQALIESTMLKQHKGDTVYRFTWQNKIRELQVSEELRQQLSKGELAVTWLNGKTCFIPAETASTIRQINAQWRLFINEASADDQDDEHPVPDDLIW